MTDFTEALQSSGSTLPLLYKILLYFVVYLTYNNQTIEINSQYKK